MAHLLPLSSSASEIREIQNDNHAPTITPPGHRRGDLWFDPLLDNLLNPTKGETLWFEKSKWIQIPGYKTPFKVPGNLEITLSPIAYLNDYLKIHAGLVSYNAEKLDLDIWEDTALQTPYLSWPVGGAFQESIRFELDELLGKVGLANTIDFLDRVEKIALSKGTHRFYINIKNGKDYMGPLFPVKIERTELTQALLQNGYTLSGEYHYLYKNTYVQHLYKEISGPASSPETPLTVPDCEWGEWPEDNAPPLRKFGVFLLKNGHVRGGLFGGIEIAKAFIPHSYINQFWIDASVRGTGLGTKIMNIAFDHSKQKGAHVVELGTTDFHAPLFYEKMGFVRICTVPKIIRTNDGKLNNDYAYRKYL